MKIQIIIEGKTYIYHLSKNCDVKLVVRNGLIKDVLEQKRVVNAVVEPKKL